MTQGWRQNPGLCSSDKRSVACAPAPYGFLGWVLCSMLPKLTLNSCIQKTPCQALNAGVTRECCQTRFPLALTAVVKDRGQVTVVTERTWPMKDNQGHGSRGEQQMQGQEEEHHPNLLVPCSVKEEVEALKGLLHTPLPLRGPSGLFQP